MSTAPNANSQIPYRVTDYSGRPIGPLRLAGAMRLIILSGTCIMSSIGVLWPPAAVTIVFLQEQLGASKAMTGLNLTLVLLAFGTAMPGALPFNRLQQRKIPWIITMTTARLFFLLPCVVALLSNRHELHAPLTWIFLLSFFMANAIGTFCSPGWWAWMGDLIPDNVLGTFFGRRFRWNLAGQSVAALAAALILDRVSGTGHVRFTYFIIFLIAGILSIIDPLLFLFVPEPVRPKPPARSFKEVVSDYLAPVRDRAFRQILVGTAIYNIFFSLTQVVLIMFLRGENHEGQWIGGHATILFLVLMSVVMAAGNAIGANLWGRLADRIGHRIVWMLSSCGYVIYLLFFFVNGNNYAWLGLLTYGLFGIFFAGQQPAGLNMVLSMAPPSRREYYMSMFQTTFYMSASIAPWLGGVLADNYGVFPSITLPSGQPACYIHLLLLIAIVGMTPAMIVMMRVPDSKGVAFLPWLGRLVTGDLLRTAWSIGVLSTSPSTSRRIRALRSITQRDGNVLLSDITSALDDPEPNVRREALLALGRLGTPEALDLLRWHLHEPDARIRAPSLEALVQAEVPDRTGLLTRALHDSDSRVRQAAISALSRTGDHDAAIALRQLLADERDGEVLVSAAIALSKMKEFGAVNEMLNLALYSENTTVRMQMLVALADLLSGTSGFQKLWRQDRHLRGKGFTRLGHRLRKQARALAKAAAPQHIRSRAEKRVLIALVDEGVENLLEQVQAEQWNAALATLNQLSIEFLRLQYRYRGDEERALEFISAIAPIPAQRYWLLRYLRHTCETNAVPEAPWDGLTLLAMHTLVWGLEPS